MGSDVTKFEDWINEALARDEREIQELKEIRNWLVQTLADIRVSEDAWKRSCHQLSERCEELRKALTDVLNSEVVKQAPFASYSEALDRARTVLRETKP